MKTKFTQTTGGTVTVEYDDVVYGERVKRTFFTRGRYVYEDSTRDGSGRQVCDRLSTRGESLVAQDDLLFQIRTEYKKMRRAEKNSDK